MNEVQLKSALCDLAEFGSIIVDNELDAYTVMLSAAPVECEVVRHDLSVMDTRWEVRKK